MKVYIAQINPIIGDIKGNTKKILHEINRARVEKADIVLTPELAICGYPPEDLLLFDNFIDEIEKNLENIIKRSKDLFIAIGTVRKNSGIGKKLFNTAAIIIDGKLKGYKDKTVLPDFDVFNETRYFEKGKEHKVFEYKGKKIGVLICAELWQKKALENKQIEQNKLEELRKLKPDLVLALNASPYYFQKNKLRYEVYVSAARTIGCDLILCNQVGANDQLVFDGYSMYIDKKGNIKQIAKGFVEDSMIVDTDAETFSNLEKDDIKDLYSALVLGVQDYFKKQGFSKACIGISGGIDSAITACIAVDALGSNNVLGVRMPCRFSSISSIEDAEDLSNNLKIELKDIPIDNIFQHFLNLLSPVFYGKPFSSAEENLQARIRGIVLMGISNKLGYVILSTGNKSEMATGYTTLYGDMCGGLGVLSDVSKTNVYKLAEFVNRKKCVIPKSIVEKAPSAELRKDQKDSDSLPDYSIVDKILEEYVENHRSIDAISKKYGFEKEVVLDLVERIHLAEYKRRQGPPGIRVTKKSFDKGRLFPIVQGWI